MQMLLAMQTMPHFDQEEWELKHPLMCWIVQEYAVQELPGYRDCYDDINLLPPGEHHIQPGKSYRDATKRPPTIFWEMKF